MKYCQKKRKEDTWKYTSMISYNRKGVCRFLGLTNYHRRFIKDYSKKARPVTAHPISFISSPHSFRFDRNLAKSRFPCHSFIDDTQHDQTQPLVAVMTNNMSQLDYDQDAGEIEKCRKV
jgi:hypothetical protein